MPSPHMFGVLVGCCSVILNFPFHYWNLTLNLEKQNARDYYISVEQNSKAKKKTIQKTVSNLSGSRFGRNKCLRNILNIQMLNRKFDLYREHLTLSMRVLPSIKLFQAVADIRTLGI